MGLSQAAEHFDPQRLVVNQLLAQSLGALIHLFGGGTTLQLGNLGLQALNPLTVILQLFFQALLQLPQPLLLQLSHWILLRLHLLLLGLLARDVLGDEHLGGGVGQFLGLLRIGVRGVDLEELSVFDVVYRKRALYVLQLGLPPHLLRHQLGKGSGAHELGVGIGQAFGRQGDVVGQQRAGVGRVEEQCGGGLVQRHLLQAVIGGAGRRDGHQQQDEPEALPYDLPVF